MTKKLTIFLVFLIFLISGCATMPPREKIATYEINGTTYVSLVSLCERRQISWDYDTFAKTVVLQRGAHKINLRVGDTMALVDGRAEYLHHPVDIYQGVLVIPLRFKEQVIDYLFKPQYAQAKETPLILAIKKVVIDAGHGGHDPGAIGRSGLREKDVNLDIAKRLSKLLRDNGITVVMTRSSDIFVPLERRVDIANNAKADLFISIHSNANRVRSLSGLEIYYISPRINDSKRALLTAQDTKLDFDSSCFSHTSLNTKATLWDMIYTFNRGESIQLAGNICKTAGRNLDTRIIGVKGANFQVLKGTQMPAILIESGFLSNREEEKLLKNGYYRQQVAEAIEQGIKNYARTNFACGG
jgi:N-acetylmuramoyl-L-alanine amidase